MAARHSHGILCVAGICTAAALLHAQSGTPLQIVTSSLPPATVNSPYNQQLVTSGGTCSSVGSPSSTIDSGALPSGLFITSPVATEQWTIQGTPSATGTFTFTVHVVWTHTRTTPFEQQCVDEAVKTLSLTVQTNQSLSVDRPQITATYRIPHFPPGADTVHVTSTGSAPIAITVQAVTDSGGPWLTATAQSAATPAALSIGYLVSGLAQGTYTGRVTISTGGTVALTIPVTLLVTADTSVVLKSSPSSLAFSMIVGGTDPPSQSLNIAVAAGDSAIFQATVTAAPPNGKWLTVTPGAAATPSTLTVAVASKGLAAAVYSGVLTIAASGESNVFIAIPVTFTIQAPQPKPTITAGGVINAAGAGPGIAPGTWVSLFGTSLSATTRAWRTADFQNGQLPTALDGVSVTLDGKPAAIAFISPGQINVLEADDTVTGLVPVLVKNTLGASDSVLALQQTAAPALFQFPGTSYAAAVHVDGSYVAGPALVKQGIPGTAVKVGETIVLFGTGFGATLPAISATALVPAPLPLAHPEQLGVRIGGLDATIAYAGLISPGLYQFNVVVPQIADGDQPVVAELRGLLTQSGVLITVQH